MATFRVNLIRSERAVKRENLEDRALESFIGDYFTIEEAEEVYENLSIGVETDKELLKIEDNGDEEILKTTY